MTNRFTLLVAVMTLVSLACSMQVATPVMTAAPTSTDTPKVVMTDTPNPTDTAVWTAQVSRAQINVRAEPDGDEVIGNLKSGDTVTILRCVGDWCKIKQPAGWVFRGCLSDNPDSLGCTAK